MKTTFIKLSRLGNKSFRIQRDALVGVVDWDGIGNSFLYDFDVSTHNTYFIIIAGSLQVVRFVHERCDAMVGSGMFGLVAIGIN